MKGTIWALLLSLKGADRGIEVWQDDRTYLPGFRQMQLSFFYATREEILSEIRALR
jgi:hypothetical protein